MSEPDEPTQERYGLGQTLALIGLWMIRMIALIPLTFYFRILNRTTIIGRENIPDKGGLLALANHRSWVDTVLLPYTGMRRFALRKFMAPAKRELFDIPLIGFLITITGAFPVTRSSGSIEPMKKIARAARRWFVMIYPEGTRSKSGALARAKSSVGWILYHGRSRAIPTLLINTEHYPFAGKGKKWINTRYYVVYGEPLDLSRFYARVYSKELAREIADAVMAEIKRLRDERLDLYIDPPPDANKKIQTDV